MKTEAITLTTPALQVVEQAKTFLEKPSLRIAHKSDLHNHRFALHDNKAIQDPTNWDHSWFAQYE